jgi:hypothetical protein
MKFQKYNSHILLIWAYDVEVCNDMKKDIKVLKINLYGCSGIERTKNKVSENSLHFIPLLVGEK